LSEFALNALQISRNFLETYIRIAKTEIKSEMFLQSPNQQCINANNCVYTADTDMRKQLCLVRVDGVNKL